MLIEEAVEDPADGVRWHQQLREAAEAWRRLSACAHEEPNRYQLERQVEKARQTENYLKEAMTAR